MNQNHCTMLLYDPQHPEMFTYFRRIQLATPVLNWLWANPRCSEYSLCFNQTAVGRISILCNTVICQCSICDGILTMYGTHSGYFQGFLLIHRATANCVIPNARALHIDSSFATP